MSASLLLGLAIAGMLTLALGLTTVMSGETETWHSERSKQSQRRRVPKP